MADRTEYDRLVAELRASAADVETHEIQFEKCEALCLSQTPPDPLTLERHEFIESCLRLVRRRHAKLEADVNAAKAAYFAAVRGQSPS